MMEYKAMAHPERGLAATAERAPLDGSLPERARFQYAHECLGEPHNLLCAHGRDDPFGVMILTLGAFIEEKKSGTAEWVLSAPLSREAFVFSKLAVNLLWIFGVLVLLKGVAYEFVLMAFGVDIIAVVPLVRGLFLQGFHLIFWLTLTLMLGTFFKGRGGRDRDTSAAAGLPGHDRRPG